MTPYEKEGLRHKKRMDKLEYKQRKKELKSGAKKVSYSKGVLTFIVVILIGTLAFAMYEMHIQNDLTALYALITGPSAAALAAVISYMWKSAKENTKGGVVHDAALYELEGRGEESMNAAGHNPDGEG